MGHAGNGRQEYITSVRAYSSLVDTHPGPCYNRLIMSRPDHRQIGTPVPRVQVIGITGLPEVHTGNRLGEMISGAALRQGTPLMGGDVLVVTQKAVSKAEGRIVDLATVTPSPEALQLAAETERDPRLVELILRESRSLVRVDTARGLLITETRHGFVCANAGIDTSNVPGDGVVSLLPEDSDMSARRIQGEVYTASPGIRVAVIVSDTFGRAWREGHTNFAIGIAGIDPFRDYRGTLDSCGKTLKVTRIAVADELTSTAELVVGKASGIPAAIIRGYPYPPGEGSVASLIRDPSLDLFR